MPWKGHTLCTLSSQNLPKRSPLKETQRGGSSHLGSTYPSHVPSQLPSKKRTGIPPPYPPSVDLLWSSTSREGGDERQKLSPTLTLSEMFCIHSPKPADDFSCFCIVQVLCYSNRGMPADHRLDKFVLESLRSTY